VVSAAGRLAAGPSGDGAAEAGSADGEALGSAVGAMLGSADGEALGSADGDSLGTSLGTALGTSLGTALSLGDGVGVGSTAPGSFPCCQSHTRGASPEAWIAEATARP